MDLIDRQAAIEALNEKCLMPVWCKVLVKKMLKDLPSAQPERKKGKWVNANDGKWNACSVLKCSACGEIDNRMYETDNFCPNCGARMGGDGMSDLIDRQAAIKAIEDLQDCYNGFSDTYDKACIIGVLEELPSAQSDVPDREAGEWDMFDLITSVYFGKRYYFVEENGLVYSRETHKYMTKDDAISEFLGIIGE